MKCIVGLGNPGKRYEKTRHNAGFMVIDELIRRNNFSLNRKKFNGHFALESIGDQQVILLKPQTFMNVSGESVQPLLGFYKIDPKDLLVIYDDLDLPTGKIRLRQNGGHGGHNGMRSIIDATKTNDFNRIRIGIDRPQVGMSVTDHVLNNFSKKEKDQIEESIQVAADAAESWLNRSFLEVMNIYN